MGIRVLAVLIVICGLSISQNTAGFYMLDVGSKHYLLDMGSEARLEEEPRVNHDTFQPQEFKHHDNNGNIIEDDVDGDDHFLPCPDHGSHPCQGWWGWGRLLYALPWAWNWSLHPIVSIIFLLCLLCLKIIRAVYQIRISVKWCNMLANSQNHLCYQVLWAEQLTNLQTQSALVGLTWWWIVLVIASFTQYPLRRLFRGLNQMETMTCRKNSYILKATTTLQKLARPQPFSRALATWGRVRIEIEWSINHHCLL